MEKICKNCECFAPATISGNDSTWGNCTKGVNSTGLNDREGRSNFAWADKTCGDFRQRQTRPR